MKTILISYKFLFMTLITLPLAMCSDDDNTAEETPFEPIEITFIEDFLTDCNQIKTISGVDLSIRKLSINERPANVKDNEEWEIPECIWDDYRFFRIPADRSHPWKGSVTLGLGLYDCLEIDFSNVKGISKITLPIDDQCDINTFKANLYEGGNVVSTQGNKLFRSIENLVFDNITNNSTKIRVWACEGSLGKILIE